MPADRHDAADHTRDPGRDNAGNLERDEALRWVERVATFCNEAWGLAPITGRILGWLMICDPPEQSAGDIADAIGASRASLTANLRLLTAMRLVRRHTRSGERTAYYRMEDDAWEKVVRQRLAAFAAFHDVAEEALRLRGLTEARTRRIRSAQKSIALLVDSVEQAQQAAGARAEE
ncbi:GbsR/MarR family transcriptional regulator [Goodfellowiella coeruleoviolacea]|uniref:MarR family protein n=1 Tax=Goodfellowiella coeruleoviolacea TaxID=334858 RepID=A0AAE3GL26_9PSEU|nr:transcriptional regulator [Goodfellowiella coeruleoviolacea]MCP2170222.1 MarR family protein [Goodfellowiella coeruleoviolacea]